MSNFLKVLFIAGLMAQAMFAADVTGKWSGTTKGKTPDGEMMHDSVYMELQQSGATVTGTAGPGADRQAPINGGKVEGDQVEFKLTVGEAGVTVKLKIDGEALKGQANVDTPDGKLVLDLDLKRVK